MASGHLYLAFEQLKENLEKEGYSMNRWKSPLPVFPQKIGVVTAQTGAAIQDICSTIERRYPLAEIILFPAIVQGPQAAPSIVQAIEQAEHHGAIDVLIVGRGGGSIEDLWAFNEEALLGQFFLVESQLLVLSDMKQIQQLLILSRIEERLHQQRQPKWQFLPEMSWLKDFGSETINLSVLCPIKLKMNKNDLTTLQTSYPFQFPERLYRPFTEKLIGLEGRLNREVGMILRNRNIRTIVDLSGMLSLLFTRYSE